MEFVKGTVGVIGKVICTTLISSAVLVVSVGVVSTLTKPSDDSFSKHIEGIIQENINHENDNFIERGTKKIAAKAINTTVVKNIEDYGVIKVGHIKEEGKDHYFVGTLNHWINVPK